MNIFAALIAALTGKKKADPLPDYSDRMAKIDRAYERRDQRVGKSHGAPSQRMAFEQSRSSDDIMSNPLHPLNPISPISIYNTHTPMADECRGYDSSSSSSYDSSSSSSSSCDSSSSSSSSD